MRTESSNGVFDILLIDFEEKIKYDKVLKNVMLLEGLTFYI